EVPAGRVRRGDSERLVRITGRIVDPRSFTDITVAVRDGTPVRIGDVARVVDGIAEPRSAAMLDGRPAVSLEILKISGSNTVEVAENITSILGDMQRELPSDVQLSIVSDDSRRIRA